MKKTNAFIAAALTASILTSCGGTDTAEMTSAENTVSETTTATVSETDTMSAESEETTTEDTAEEPIDETVLDDFEDDPELPVEDEGVFDPAKLEFHCNLTDGAEYIEITENTKFYECRYVTDKVIHDENDFNDKAALEKARKILQENKDIMDELNIIKDAFDSEGDIELRLVEGITMDFDHNGTEESFMLFNPFINDKSTVGYQNRLLSYLFFENSSGDVRLLGEPTAAKSLCELRYNDFSHLVVDGGFNNSTSSCHFYSVNGNDVKLELEQFMSGYIADGVVLVQTESFAPWSWLVFWNAEAGKYVTPVLEYMSDEDEDLVFDRLPLDNEDAEIAADMKISVIGRKFFNILYPKTFILKNDKFVEMEDRALGGNRGSYPIEEAVNFDYDKALENLIPIEEE